MLLNLQTPFCFPPCSSQHVREDHHHALRQGHETQEHQGRAPLVLSDVQRSILDRPNAPVGHARMLLRALDVRSAQPLSEPSGDRALRGWREGLCGRRRAGALDRHVGLSSQHCGPLAQDTGLD